MNDVPIKWMCQEEVDKMVSSSVLRPTSESKEEQDRNEDHHLSVLPHDVTAVYLAFPTDHRVGTPTGNAADAEERTRTPSPVKVCNAYSTSFRIKVADDSSRNHSSGYA